MNYAIGLWRCSILSLTLALCLGALPAQSAPTSEKIAQTAIALDQSVKVTPQLERQILEVIRRHPEVMFEVLQKYAVEQQNKERQAQEQALAKLRKNTAAFIGNSPVQGATARKIVMLEFSDFQCPYCAAATKNIQQFMAKHGDRVTRVYKHFPLTQIHSEALPAATAAWAANKQGKFWEYHDALFANQAKLGEAFYLENANNLKLDINKFKLDRRQAEGEIAKDFQLGRKLGIEGTPTFIINGVAVSGNATVAEFEAALKSIDN